MGIPETERNIANKIARGGFTVMNFLQMPRSYWLSIITAVGVALAGAIHAEPINNDAGNQPGPAQTRTQPQDQESIRSLDAIKREIERFNSALEANIDKPKSTEEKEQAQRDLIAQENMAYWAKWMLWATVGTVLVTFAGVLLILRTLDYTREAANYARDMVGETKKATAAAEEANRTMRDIGEAQTRAYLSFSERTLEIKADTKYPSFRYKIRNTGNSPAKQFRMTFRAAYSVNGIARIQPGYTPIWGPKGGVSGLDIVSNETRDYGHMFTDFPMNEAEEAAIHAGQIVVFEIIAKIEFEDVFDKTISETQDLAAAGVQLGQRVPMFKVPFTGFRLRLQQNNEQV